MNEWYEMMKSTVLKQTLSERTHLTKESITKLPFLKVTKPLRVSSITNLRNCSPDKFQKYIRQIQLKRLTKASHRKLTTSEPEFQFLNLKATQIKIQEKDQKYINLNNSSSSPIMPISISNSYIHRFQHIRQQLQGASNQDAKLRVKTLNNIDISNISESVDKKQQLYMKLTIRNALIKQTIKQWVKQRTSIHKQTQN